MRTREDRGLSYREIVLALPRHLNERWREVARKGQRRGGVPEWAKEDKRAAPKPLEVWLELKRNKEKAREYHRDAERDR